jgi:cyclopropane fatty-acyl-phospholipid synthase-like methyltransferase
MLLSSQSISIGSFRANIIKKNILKSKCASVLEIGSGIGLIGSYIKKKNKNIRYLGIEIDHVSYEKSQALGLDTINSDFKIMETLEEGFDVVMLWEVLEHLQDLEAFLKLAYNRLNDGGKIILSTPNYDKINNSPKREEDNLYQDGPPIHLNFFTKTNIENIFNLYNFKNCKITIKRFPYRQLKSFRYYINIIKALFNKYHGSTIYLVAEK